MGQVSNALSAPVPEPEDDRDQERARRQEEFNLDWYEEPTIPEDVAGHARLDR